jgi:uncharacterized protein YbjT (DUF2867 family)
MSAQASPAVLVTGASSQIGVFLLPRLLEKGYRVRALSRRAGAAAETVPGLVWAHPDRELADRGAGKGEAPRFLVSAGPPSLARQLLERHPGITKAVVFSTTSVLTKLESDDAAERAAMEHLLQEESQLRRDCRALGAGLVLVRPTLVYGCGLDRNLSRLVRFGDRTGFIPLSAQAGGLRQPVHADDLAALAAEALAADTGAILEGPACGGEQLTYRAMVRRAAACCRRPVRCVEWPPRLLAAAVALAGRLGRAPGANAQMVYRQAEDLVFDDHAFRDRLDWRPRPFRPTRADFSIPDELQRYRPPA